MDSIVSLSVCVDNDAFGATYQSQAEELARIFRDLADRIIEAPEILEPSGFSSVLSIIRDANGNTVGHLTTGKE